MREETLKCLVHVVEKLDEKNLQEKLIRCITNLQNDTENSIRTNATIFLGRIAIKLKDSIRIRVLCPSFVKSMRDNFVHCRVAGLKAATACLNILDLNQLTTKLMPQVCSLLLDRSNEIRELSLRFLELSTKLMRDNHDVLSETEKKNIVIAAANNLSNDSPMKNSISSEKDGSSWASSWASSLSMTIEKTIGANSGSVTGSGIGSGSVASSSNSDITNIESSGSSTVSSNANMNYEIKDPIKKKNIPPSPPVRATTSISTSSSKSITSLDKNKMVTTGNVVQKLTMSDNWDDNDGFDNWGDDNNDDDDSSFNRSSYGNGGSDNRNQNKVVKSSGSGNNGWDADDDIDLDIDVGNDSNSNSNSNSNDNSNSNSNSHSSVPNSPLKLPTSNSNSNSNSNSKFFQDTEEKKKKAPVVPKGMTSKKSSSSSGPSMKLAMTESSDNWDDF